MDIIKEVIVKANVDYVWSCLQQKKTVFINKKPEKNKADCREIGLLDSSNLKRKWEICQIKPLNFMILKGKDRLSGISIKIELSKKNTKTLMKLRITGWERIGEEISRKEIPKISLEWENYLKRRKKIIESSNKKHVINQ